MVAAKKAVTMALPLSSLREKMRNLELKLTSPKPSDSPLVRLKKGGTLKRSSTRLKGMISRPLLLP
jgi:hypothetical protein